MNATAYEVVEGSRRVALPGAKAVGRANAHAMIDVLVKVRRKREIGTLEKRPDKALERQAVGADFGATDADIAAIAAAFESRGIRVVRTNTAARSVDVAGSVSEMEDFFQVKLFDYEHPEGNYRGRVGEVFIPTAIAGIVTGVFGLDERRVASRRRRATPRNVAKDKAALPNSWYLPKELAARYNFPAGDGSSQTIGLLEFGGGYFPDDLQQFCSIAGISPPTVVPISIDGTPTTARDGAEGEVMLDIEVVAGVCPKSTIAVYFSHWGERGWIKALDAAVHDTENKPTVLSASWGNPEDVSIWTAQAMTQVNETLKDAAMAGVTVCVSAGDDGSSDAYQDGHAHVDFPASSPYVLSVGGTTIKKKATPLPDIAWFEGDGLRQPSNPNSGSTGGGVSAVFPRPSWQQAIQVSSVNPGAIVGRCIPDVAANADWTVSPYLLYVDGGAQPNGGTSAASPLIAGMIALINGQLGAGAPVGYLSPLLYQSAGEGGPIGALVCSDVLAGSNATAKAGGYAAQPGYDAVSGWGTPDGSKLAQALSSLSAHHGGAGASD